LLRAVGREWVKYSGIQNKILTPKFKTSTPIPKKKLTGLVIRLLGGKLGNIGTGSPSKM
jgi:hypothetical protein